MKIIIVADKQASKFLSNRKNLGPMGKNSVVLGDIVKGELDVGPFVWNGERWVVEDHNVLIHSPQITSKDEAESLVASLQRDDDYDTVIIGCDPSDTLHQLNSMLKKVFGDNNVNIVYPSLYENYTEFDSLQDRIRSLLNLPAVEEADVKTEETEESEESDGDLSKSSRQVEPRHLRVTLTNSADPKSTPSIIDVLFNEGDHLELDFRNTNQETK